MGANADIDSGKTLDVCARWNVIMLTLRHGGIGFNISDFMFDIFWETGLGETNGLGMIG